MQIRYRSYHCAVFLGKTLLAFVLAVGAVFAAEGSEKEYLLKAAFIYNFGLFVEWPNEGALKVFHICVLGENNFGESLRALEQRRRLSQSISVEIINSPDQIKNCQIVYLDMEIRDRLAEIRLTEIVAQLRGKPVLTVSSAADFAARGGAVGFLLENGKVRFDINTATMRTANLKPSSKLMAVARRLIDTDAGGDR